MNSDLKIIKKQYGEKMMHLCRELFPSILEEVGLLSKILLDHFEPNHSLYSDLVENACTYNFKEYIYELFSNEHSVLQEKEEEEIYPSPEELLLQAGYILYECKTERDIEQFRKYYREDEELCTFRNNRLKRCHVFFAVKKNVDSIKREDFTHPERQDEYGTSVISIQFSRDNTHTLSIKNRYNHSVDNPDATFSNNLDNIIPGLTKSFEQKYELKQKYINKFEIPGYTRAKDGKYYKYNHEISNIYYCPNNIIIDHGEVKRLPKERYILMDYFVVDLSEKKIKLYDSAIIDSFIQTMDNIGKIEIRNIGENKKIIFKFINNDKEVIIELNKNNEMLGLINNHIREIDDNFLKSNKRLKTIELRNVRKIANSFLESNRDLENIIAPNLEETKSCFLYYNERLKVLDLPNLIYLGKSSLYRNKILEVLKTPKLREVDYGCFIYNTELEVLHLPNFIQAGNSFFYMNKKIRVFIAPNFQKAGDYCFFHNTELEVLDLPSFVESGQYFLSNNQKLKVLKVPNAKKFGDNCFSNNKCLVVLDAENLEEVGNCFLAYNETLKIFNVKHLKKLGYNVLLFNNNVNLDEFVYKIKEYKK